MSQTGGHLRHLSIARRCRPFGLADALIVIAMLGVAFWIFRRWRHWPWTTLVSACGGIALMLLVYTAGWLALRLRSPRPARRFLFRQPGMVACVVALVTAVLCLVPLLVLRFSVPPSQHALAWKAAIAATPPIVAFSVLAAWITLAISGRRRPEPGWIDRLGRVVASGWVALALFYLGALIYCSNKKPGPPNAAPRGMVSPIARMVSPQ